MGVKVYPVQPVSPFPSISCASFSLHLLHSLFEDIFYPSPCFSPGHPGAHHILYFSKCFCFHLLYFPVHPPSVTSLFLDTVGSVQRCLCVCVSSGCWPDFQVISMPTSFLPSLSRVAPDREVTPVHSPLGVRDGPNAEAAQEGGDTRNEGKEMVGRRGAEEIGWPQPPTAKPATQLEMAHSVCMLEGLTSIKKKKSPEQRQELEIEVWMWVYFWQCVCFSG